MDARGFSEFLKKRLQEALTPIEHNILNIVNNDSDSSLRFLYQNAGARTILVDILNKMEKFVEEYTESGV